MHRSESRETAYIHAINSAALAWSITRACSRGDLTECSCDNSIRRKQRKWQWGGCSEVNIALLFFSYSHDKPDSNNRSNRSRRTSIMVYYFQENSLILKKVTKLQPVWWICITTKRDVGYVSQQIYDEWRIITKLTIENGVFFIFSFSYIFLLNSLKLIENLGIEIANATSL